MIEKYLEDKPRSIMAILNEFGREVELVDTAVKPTLLKESRSSELYKNVYHHQNGTTIVVEQVDRTPEDHSATLTSWTPRTFSLGGTKKSIGLVLNQFREKGVELRKYGS